MLSRASRRAAASWRRRAAAAAAAGERPPPHTRPTIDFYDQTVEAFASKTPIHVTMQHCVEYSRHPTREKEMTLSKFLARELPIRLAHTIRGFQVLPYIVVVNPWIESIYASYLESFQQLAAAPPITDYESHLQFCRFLVSRLQAHANVISDLSKGIKDVRLLPDSANVDFRSLDRFLDQLLVQRISRRLLAEQLLIMHQLAADPPDAPRNERAGVFTMNLRPADVAENCLSQVTYLAEETYGHAPTWKIEGDVDATFPFVASHLEYILFELCKNAVRATIENHRTLKGSALPPVTVRVCQGRELTLVISDQGGGLGDEAQQNAGSYGFSTSRPSHRDTEYYKVSFGATEDGPEKIQFAGFGFGLPLSRIYSQYHGGTLTFQSLPGYGTDFYLRMPTGVSSVLLPWEMKSRPGTFDST
eukprot:TRINITY_DN2519_c0_g1_i1.p1 TRINITY_DN2519_c0_g1~~TRINITY_DN2519_c0_g1_i1.p1  ORF type:complete len:418 (+),score=66.02 TRINITY_DN2519_c0_g1_i1:72-1325(+)